MDKKERDSGIVISDKLLFLCNMNNQQNKKYDVANGIYKYLLHDMYEGRYKVLDYPADCTTAPDKADQRNTTQKTIAGHINGKKASISWIKRYCKFFGCSADYMLGLIDCPTKEITDIHNATGLTPISIKGLKVLNAAEKEVLNNLLTVKRGLYFKRMLAAIRQFLYGNYRIPITHQIVYQDQNGITVRNNVIPSDSADFIIDDNGNKVYILHLQDDSLIENDTLDILIDDDYTESTAINSLSITITRFKDQFKNFRSRNK